MNGRNTEITKDKKEHTTNELTNDPHS